MSKVKKSFREDWTSLLFLLITAIGFIVAVIDFIFLQNLKFQFFGLIGLALVAIGGYLRMKACMHAYELSKQKPEEWAQKERKVEEIHKELEACLDRAIRSDRSKAGLAKFLLNTVEIAKDWKSRGGLEVNYKDCRTCKEGRLVTIIPLYKDGKWGYWMGATCKHVLPDSALIVRVPYGYERIYNSRRNKAEP